MTYKLAKQLKEAGWPQGLTGISISGNAWKECYSPGLSELIEACGDRFRTLIYCGCKECKWNVHGDSEIDDWDDEMRLSFNGKTPEEAVAKLWLKLNK